MDAGSVQGVVVQMMVETFLPASAGSIFRGIVEQRVLYPDGWAGVVFVFDFGFGQGGLVVDAPVHRAQALVDEVVFVKSCKKVFSTTDSYCGVMVAVGPVETSEDADPFELLALQIEKLLRQTCGTPGAHRAAASAASCRRASGQP